MCVVVVSQSKLFVSRENSNQCNANLVSSNFLGRINWMQNWRRISWCKHFVKIRLKFTFKYKIVCVSSFPLPALSKFSKKREFRACLGFFSTVKCSDFKMFFKLVFFRTLYTCVVCLFWS